MSLNSLGVLREVDFGSCNFWRISQRANVNSRVRTSKIESLVRWYASDWKIEMAPNLMRRNATSRHDLLQKFNRVNFQTHVKLHELNARLSNKLTTGRSFYRNIELVNVANISQILPTDVLPFFPSTVFTPRFKEQLKMMTRHHARYHDRVTTIVNFVCLRSRRLRWRRKGSEERRGGWQGHCAKWPRRRVWQSAHRTFVLSLMNYSLTYRSAARPMCTWSSTTLSRTWSTHAIREISRREKETPGHEARVMDEMRTKRMPRSRCKRDDDDDNTTCRHEQSRENAAAQPTLLCFVLTHVGARMSTATRLGQSRPAAV